MFIYIIETFCKVNVFTVQIIFKITHQIQDVQWKKTVSKNQQTKTFMQEKCLENNDKEKNNYFVHIAQSESIFPSCFKLVLNSTIDLLNFIELAS